MLKRFTIVLLGTMLAVLLVITVQVALGDDCTDICLGIEVSCQCSNPGCFIDCGLLGGCGCPCG